MNIESVERFLSDPAAAVEYQKWCKDPMTRTVIGLVRGMFQPTPLGINPDGSKALYQYGLIEATHHTLSFLENLGQVLEYKKLADAVSAEASYGAEKIMKEKYGYK